VNTNCLLQRSVNVLGGFVPRKISDRKPREKEERKISAKKVPRLGKTKRGRRAREYELLVA